VRHGVLDGALGDVCELGTSGPAEHQWVRQIIRHHLSTRGNGVKGSIDVGFRRVGFGTGRQRMALKRRTAPTLSWCTCCPRDGLHSRYMDFGKARRNGGVSCSPTRIPTRAIRNFHVAVVGCHSTCAVVSPLEPISGGQLTCLSTLRSLGSTALPSGAYQRGAAHLLVHTEVVGVHGAPLSSLPAGGSSPACPH
jgi:hypothetical protein